jgi:hypothetical protein
VAHTLLSSAAASHTQGSCKVNDTIELPALKQSRPVKGIHMFHQPVAAVQRGDRAGLCVTQLNPKLLERGLAAAPGSVPTFAAAVAAVDKVRFYGAPVPSKAKYHVIVGHATVMAEATFFGLPDGQGSSQSGWLVWLVGCPCCSGLATRRAMGGRTQSLTVDCVLPPPVACAPDARSAPEAGHHLPAPDGPARAPAAV